MNAPAPKKNDIAVITEDIYALRDSFITVAFDRSINFEKEAGFAVQLLSANDYALKAAMGNREAVRNAVTNVAAIGISLNPAKKQAYLVPRKVRGTVTICLDISYIGLIDLAIATGSISWAQAKIVREHDNFTLNALDELPTHSYEPFAGAEKRGAIVGAYVVVKTIEGEYLTHPMDIGAVYGIRDRSESWKSYVEKQKKGEYAQPGPWGTDEEEMIKKTVVKQAYKYWPKTDRSSRVDEAIQYLNTEGGEGFDTLKGSGENSYPVNDLAEWKKKATGAPTAEALASIWQTGLAAIRPSKDLGAYNAFKDAVIARKAALATPPAGAEVTDVEDKTVNKTPAATTAADEKPDMNKAKVLDLMTKAKNAEQLDIAADWIKDLPDQGEKDELNAKYDELKQKFQQ